MIRALLHSLLRRGPNPDTLADLAAARQERDRLRGEVALRDAQVNARDARILPRLPLRRLVPRQVRRHPRYLRARPGAVRAVE